MPMAINHIDTDNLGVDYELDDSFLSQNLISVSKDDSRIFDVDFELGRRISKKKEPDYSFSVDSLNLLMLLETSPGTGFTTNFECDETSLVRRMKPITTNKLIIGLLMLVVAIISGALIGPLTMAVPGGSPYIKAIWRTQGTALMYLPIMLLFYACDKDKRRFAKDHTSQKLLASAASSFCSFIWYTCFIVGCSKAVTSHASAMYNSTGIFVFFVAIATSKAIHRLEVLGYILFTAGVIWLLTDPIATKIGVDTNNTFGCLISLIGASAGALQNFLLQKNNATRYHPITTITHTFCFSALFQLVFLPHLAGFEDFYSFHPENGAFGWIGNWTNFALILFVIVPFTGLLGNLGHYITYKHLFVTGEPHILVYFALEVISGTILIEPFIAQLMAVFLGQDNMPGSKTWVGLVIISIGTLLAKLGTRYKLLDEIKNLMEEEKA